MLSDVAGENIAHLMSCWIEKAGHPLLTVTSTFHPDSQTLKLQVSQQLLHHTSVVPSSAILPTNEKGDIVYTIPVVVEARIRVSQGKCEFERGAG